MPQGYTVPIPQRVWDADGLPASGWKFTTYEPGTTTPLITYSDTQLSAQNTNPVLTNASGFFVTNVGAPGGIYVAAGVDIKLSVTDENDVPQANYSVDNLLPMVDPTIPDPSVTAVPTGGGCVYFGPASPAPTGFLICDGSLVSRTTYDDLFAVIGTTYGVGDGMTTFGLPDCRGMFLLGVSASGTGNTLGGTGGLIDHVHAGPAHTHTTAVPRAGWGATLNAPSTDGTLNTGESTGTGQFSSSYQPTGDQTVTSSSSGSGNTGTANPPFLAVHWAIKT